MTGWQLRAWRYGDWDIAAGQFFTTFRRDVHVIPAFREIPETWRIWAALDYGFQHYTTVYLLAEADSQVYLVDEHGAQKWGPSRHVDAVRSMLSRYDLDLGDLSAFVAGGDVFGTREEGRTIADSYRDLGLTLNRANADRINGAAAILEGLGDVEAGIAPRLWVTERCANLIETLPLLQHDPNFPEKVLKWDTDEDGVGGDDWYDGARYGVMARTIRKGYGHNPLAAYRG